MKKKMKTLRSDGSHARRGPDFDRMVKRYLGAVRHVRRLDDLSEIRFESLDELRTAINDGEQTEHTITELINAAVTRESGSRWDLIWAVFRAHGTQFTTRRFAPMAVDTGNYLIIVSPDDDYEEEVAAILTIVPLSSVAAPGAGRRRPDERAAGAGDPLAAAAGELLGAMRALTAMSPTADDATGEGERDEAERRLRLAQGGLLELLRARGLAGVSYRGELLLNQACDRTSDALGDCTHVTVVAFDKANILDLDDGPDA